MILLRNYELRYSEILENQKNQNIINSRYQEVTHLFSHESFSQEVQYNIWLSLKNSVGSEDLNTINENTIIHNAITKAIRERMAQRGYQRINDEIDEYDEQFLKNGQPAIKTHPQKIKTDFEKRLLIDTEPVDTNNNDFKSIDIPDNYNFELEITENNELYSVLESMVTKLKKNDIPFFLDMADGLSNSELQEKYSMSPQSVSNKKNRIQKKLRD